MRYDLSIRESVRTKVTALAKDMVDWEAKPRIQPKEQTWIKDNVKGFTHTTEVDEFRIGGVDGSGDYPSLTYADCYVHLGSAAGVIYKTDTLRGLVEEEAMDEPLVEIAFLPEDRSAADPNWKKVLEALAGRPMKDVIAGSDYKDLKQLATGRAHTVDELYNNLVFPRSNDHANVGIQIRTMAEMGSAIRVINQAPACRYVLMDTTMSLPFVTNPLQSLFFEHLKRLCCVEASKLDLGFFTLSKSHGFPAMELLLELISEGLGQPKEDTAEHWFLRLPMPDVEGFPFALANGRQIPPLGAVSYLFRTHKNVPVLRLDVDREYWEKKLRHDPKAEQKLFEDLDYSGHDQRAYGYPYPIKACHDRVRLTKNERAALRKQIIDAAVAAGMKRSHFRDVSMATGHN